MRLIKWYFEEPQRGTNEETKIATEIAFGSKNIRFSEASSCAEAFGFRLSRTSGDHHIYVHTKIPELVNLQDIGGKAKPYQVKQLLEIIERYNLQLEDEE